MYDEIIPIGEGCSAAFSLIELGYRNLSYPFDWYIYVTPKHLINAFEDDFQHFIPTIEEIEEEYIRKNNDFLVKAYEQKYKLTINFLKRSIRMLQKLPQNTEKLNVVELWYRLRYRMNGEKDLFCFQNKYGMVSVHSLKNNDFDENGNLNPEVYYKFKTTFERRIQRLISLLNSSKKILFFHVSYTTSIDPDDRAAQLIKLAEIIKQKYPVANFKIIGLGSTSFKTIRTSDVTSKAYRWSILHNDFKTLRYRSYGLLLNLKKNKTRQRPPSRENFH